MKFFKTIRRSNGVRRLASFFITQYVRLVWATSKWDVVGKEHIHFCREKNQSIIACFWHGRLLMMFKSWLVQHKLHMLISNHPDGQIIARTTQHFGFGWIAGSSSKGGLRALLNILKVLKTGESVGVTPDGPRGPRYQVGLNVIQMARLGKVALLPISYSARRGIFMKSWDRFFLPFPFSRGVFIYGPIIDVKNSSKSDEELRQQLESSLKSLTQQADLYCGQEVSE